MVRPEALPAARSASSHPQNRHTLLLLCLRFRLLIKNDIYLCHAPAGDGTRRYTRSGSRVSVTESTGGTVPLPGVSVEGRGRGARRKNQTNSFFFCVLFAPYIDRCC